MTDEEKIKALHAAYDQFSADLDGIVKNYREKIDGLVKKAKEEKLRKMKEDIQTLMQK